MDHALHPTPSLPNLAASGRRTPADWRGRLRRWAARIDALDAVNPALEPTLAWLVRLRWAAVAGQSVTVVIARQWVGLVMPLATVLALLGVTAASNAFLALRVRRGAAVRRSLVVRILLLDTLILTGLLACTGGAHNPFACFYLVHVAMAAVALGSLAAWSMAALATLGYGLLFVVQGPHAHHAISESLHLRGMLCATALAAACIAYFAGRLNRELRLRELALSELRLLRVQNERFAALATLAAGVAHELGSPLGTIAVAARELERNAELAASPVWQEDAGLIRAEVDRCREILGRLNARSTNELGEASASFPLDELIAAASAGLSQDQRTRLQVESPAGGDLFLPRAAVCEALRSLLRNAFDACPTGEPVRLQARMDERSVTFVVSDAGRGLSTEAAAHATEPFFTTKPPGAGMGLGLYLVRLLAERLGGSFSLQPNEGRGAAAELRLPVAAPEGTRT